MVSGRAYFPSPVVGSIQPFRVFADHALAASGGTFSKESFLSGPQLFIHTSRPNWGRAILAAEADDRRHYQFEDGRVRTIARDFYDLLQPVNPEEAVAKKAARRLLTLLKHSDFDEPTANTPSVSMTFGDQIALFKAALPEGFEAEAYKTAFRDASRRKRAHVDASIEASRENLAVEKLDALIEAEDWKGGWKVISDVLMGCDLLSSTERKAVRGIEDEESAQLLTLAVRDLLHFVEAMTDEENGDAPCLQLPDDIEKPACFRKGETGGRLVHDDQACVDGKRAGNLEQLLFRQ